MKSKTQKIAYNSIRVISIKKIMNKSNLKIKADYKPIKLYKNLILKVKILRMKLL